MAWNEPGGGDKDPWGRRRDQGPPDLDQILKNLKAKFGGMFGGKRGGGGGGGSMPAGANRLGLGLILGVIVALWLLSGLYIVQQGENGVVLRFGRALEVTGPGLHWHLPFPVEKREIVNVEKVSTLELGYRRSDKGIGTSKIPKEALMLTQDENIISIEFAVQYRIKDASEYLFNIAEPEVTIAQAAESAVREVVGRNTLDFVLTSGRADVEQNITTILQDMLDRYKSGVMILAVEMQEALPPDEVRVAFDDVVKAREDEQRLKNEAEAYYNDVVPRARGAAARVIHEAQGYKASVVARAEGDARRFSQIVTEYAKAPGVTRERLYLDAMEDVLSQTSKIFVDQKAGNSMLYLPLDRLMQGSAGGAGPVNSLQPLPSRQETETAQEPVRERGREDLRRRGP